ncbi:MAG: hypothetical protein M3336_00045, partial [Chloroflexota bacterium]|nr:hypothetical protein [Chloroflexota bacterium]
MAGRALASLLLLSSLLLPARPASAQSIEEVWAQGQQLMRRGEYGLAQQFYAAVAEQFGGSAAPRALLLQARAALADGDTASAEATLQALLAWLPGAGSEEEADALLTLALTRRAAGDCNGALRALAAYEVAPGRLALGPYPALLRATCLGRIGDWQGQLAAARVALDIDGGGPRLTRIEILERAAEALLKLGRREEALTFYEQCLALAGTRAYRAEMLFTTATIARALGREDVDRYRAVVVELPETPRAPDALDALIEMGQGATVSPLQAGQVRLNARDYEAAVAMFDQVPSGTEDAGTAGLARATALVRLGREREAREVLVALAAAEPSVAARALLQLG